MNAPTKVKAGDTLHSAMALAFAEIEAATKGAVNPAFKQGGKVSKYADLTSIIAAIKPPLIAHGLFFTQHPQPSNGGVTVETMLHHASGESISLGALFVPANKQDPQGFGSALTYARRYALQTAFGVPVEDDDGNSAVSAIQNAPKVAGFITEEQVGQLQTYASGGVINAQRFCNFFQVASFRELPADRWPEAEAMVKAKTKQKEPA